MKKIVFTGIRFESETYQKERDLFSFTVVFVL